MLANFSSFIEILAAIYMSMCMDNLLKGFWTTQYYKDLEEALNRYYLAGHDGFVRRIVDTNKVKAKSISVYMKNRAIYFFVLCMLQVYLSGLENTLGEDKQMVVRMLMLTLLLWSVVLLCFNSYFFASKAHTAVGTILVVLMSFLTELANYLWIGFNVPSVYVVHLVLLFLVLPVLWQVFVCWTYSGPYRDYITYRLTKGKRNYELAEACLSNHDYDHLPKHYRAMYARKSIESDNAEEAKRTCLDDYLEQMEGAISKASNSHYTIKIFIVWLYCRLRDMAERVIIWSGLKKVPTISQQQS